MKKLTLSVCAVATLLLFASCGSAPKTEDTEPEAPVIEEPADETPEEPEENEEEVDQEAIDRRNAELIESIDDARQAAVDAGADEYAKEQLDALDELFDELKARADGGEDISEDAQKLEAAYRALAAYADAKKTKQRIDDEELASLSQAKYDAGCDDLAQVEDMIAAGDVDSLADMLEKANSASGNFNAVLFAAYKQKSKEERTAALEAKKQADSVKAGVSRKDDYSEAAELFKKGDSLYSMQDAIKSYETYRQSKEAFTKLYEEVNEKRAAAQKAIEEAKKRVSASEDFAASADLEAPITEPLDGIEDEDAVLLEETAYAAPEDAEADLPEDIDDPTAAEPTEADVIEE